MKNKKRELVISFIPMIIMMIVIFAFSAKNGTESSKTSGETVNVMITIFGKIPGLKMGTFDKDILSSYMELPVRKIAHMLEYAVLLATIYIPIHINFKIKLSHKAIISYIIALLYAISDETHQLFVPGRSGRVIDVCIDSIGIITSLIILTIIFVKIQKKQERKGLKE